MEIITTRNLSKRYKNHKKNIGIKGTIDDFFRRKEIETVAVDNLNLSVHEGEMIGFLGPNGAGKTTTLKMLTGILWPTYGSASVLGYTPWQRSKKFCSRISMIMGNKGQLEWDLPAIDSFELNKAIYQIEEKVYNEQLQKLTKMLEVDEYLKVPVRTLSLGQRTRLEFICSLLHKPEILFLDEPTLGLDFESQRIIHQFLINYNKETGATMILTSHYINDIEKLCKRILIINKGRIIQDAALSEIKYKFARHKLINVRFHESIHMEAIKKEISKCCVILDSTESFLQIKVKNEMVNHVVKMIQKSNSIISLNIENENIEDIIIEAFNSENNM